MHPQQQHSLGKRQTENPRFGREGGRPFDQPVLEDRQTAHIAEILSGGVVRQEAALADDLLLFGEHLIDVLAAEAGVLDDDLGEHILGLAEGQPQGGLQQPIPACRIEVDGHFLDGAHVIEDTIQQRTQVFLGGQRKTQDGDLLVQLRGNLQQWRHQDHRLEAVLQVQGDILELANDGEIGLRQERVEILEKEDRRLHLLQHLIERGERVFGGPGAALLALDIGAGRHDARGIGPLEGLLAPAGGDVQNHREHAQFLAGLDVDQRVAGSDEHLEFRGEGLGGHGVVDSGSGVEAFGSSTVRRKDASSGVR